MTTVQSKCNLQTNIILWMLIFKCLWIKILYCTRLRLSQTKATQLSTIVIHWVGYFKIWIKKLLELPLFSFLHENILSMQPWQLCMSIINSKHRMWNGCMFNCLYDVFEVDWLSSTLPSVAGWWHGTGWRYSMQGKGKESSYLQSCTSDMKLNLTGDLKIKINFVSGWLGHWTWTSSK